MDINDIEALSCLDETRAKEAFDRLYPEIQSDLGRFLASKISDAQDREEIIAKTCIRIWNVRTKFVAQGLGAWYRHIFRLCRWIALDHLRTKQEYVSLDDKEVADRAFEAISTGDTQARRRLHDLADQVWLGWDASVNSLERKRRVLAAQLFLLHGRSWPEVASVVHLRSDVDRAKFDDWVTHEPTLLHLSFKELHATNQELCEILLGQRPIMSALSQPKYRSVNWSQDQVEYIRYRFQYGIESSHLPPDLASQTTESCLALFPFMDRFDRVERSIPRPHQASKLLAKVGLWKRIVFQYHAVNDLKYKQIQERTEPIANRVGQKMNDNTMQAWLSSGRLAKQLRDAL